MKKAMPIILVILIIFTLSFSVYAASDFYKSENQRRTGYITGSNVNLRSGPGTNYPSGGLVQYGDTFTTDGRIINNYWRYCHMTSGSNYGNNGYVYRTYTSLG